MQRQVDEYEQEIRLLKDFKSPQRGSKRTPRRALTSLSDRGGMVEDSQHSASALEATFFRPALQKALDEASYWKGSAIADMLNSLPPLPSAPGAPPIDPVQEEVSNMLIAAASWRLTKSSYTLVDLTNKEKDPRLQLLEMNKACAVADARLEEATKRCKQAIIG